MTTRLATTAELPEAYQRWRASRLGRITDRLETQLILELCGPLAGRRVLDVGCGDGDLAVALWRAGAKVTGLDPDLKMLTAAEARRASHGATMKLVPGDIHSLPFESASFEVVTAIAVLCFIPDTRRAAAEMARVLAPGGRLVLGELGRWSLWAMVRRARGWLGSRTWAAANFRNARELRQLVEHAGLSVADVRGAAFYPPIGWLAAAMAGADTWLGRRATCGAAFIAVAAEKPVP